MEIIINDLKKKKQKYKSKAAELFDLQKELSLVKDERDNMLEKLKIFQN